MRGSRTGSKGAAINNVNCSGRTFAERLREAVNDSRQSPATRRHGGRRSASRGGRSWFGPVANPGRVRHSDELFVERVRQALD